MMKKIKIIYVDQHDSDENKIFYDKQLKIIKDNEEIQELGLTLDFEYVLDKEKAKLNEQFIIISSGTHKKENIKFFRGKKDCLGIALFVGTIDFHKEVIEQVISIKDNFYDLSQEIISFLQNKFSTKENFTKFNSLNYFSDTNLIIVRKNAFKSKKKAIYIEEFNDCNVIINKLYELKDYFKKQRKKFTSIEAIINEIKEKLNENIIIENPPKSAEFLEQKECSDLLSLLKQKEEIFSKTPKAVELFKKFLDEDLQKNFEKTFFNLKIYLKQLLIMFLNCNRFFVQTLDSLIINEKEIYNNERSSNYKILFELIAKLTSSLLSKAFESKVYYLFGKLNKENSSKFELNKVLFSKTILFPISDSKLKEYKTDYTHKLIINQEKGGEEAIYTIEQENQINKQIKENYIIFPETKFKVDQIEGNDIYLKIIV